MARYDVFAGAAGNYLLDVQTDLIEHLNTRMVSLSYLRRKRPRQ